MSKREELKGRLKIMRIGAGGDTETCLDIIDDFLDEIERLEDFEKTLAGKTLLDIEAYIKRLDLSETEELAYIDKITEENMKYEFENDSLKAEVAELREKIS